MFLTYFLHILIFILLFTVSILFGPSEYRFDYTLQGSLYSDPIFILRITDSLQSALCGAILGYCGYILQRVLKNPLADPYVLGISSGGVFFSVIYDLFVFENIFVGLNFIFLWVSKTIVTLFGCIFAYFCILILRKNFRGHNDTTVYPIVGIILNSLFSSALMIITYFSDPLKITRIQSSIFGAFQDIELNILIFFICITLSVVFIIKRKIKLISMLDFGDEYCISKNIDPYKLKSNLVTSVCILISISVMLCGSLAFVGLIAPHFIKRLYKLESVHESLLCFIFGSNLLLISSFASKNLINGIVLPIGIIISLVGTVFLISIISKQKLFLKSSI